MTQSAIHYLLCLNPAGEYEDLGSIAFTWTQNCLHPLKRDLPVDSIGSMGPAVEMVGPLALPYGKKSESFYSSPHPTPPSATLKSSLTSQSCRSTSLPKATTMLHWLISLPSFRAAALQFMRGSTYLCGKSSLGRDQIIARFYFTVQEDRPALWYALAPQQLCSLHILFEHCEIFLDRLYPSRLPTQTMMISPRRTKRRSWASVGISS